MKFHYSGIILCCLGLALAYPLFSQTKTVSYEASDSFIPNPEQGWFAYGTAYQPDNNKNIWLTEAFLKTYV